MKISQDAWKSYIDQLSKINKKAAEKVAAYYRSHPNVDIDELISYAYSVANYYGEAAGELACEMYDEVASVAPRVIPAAESAATATYGEIAQAIQGAMLRTNDPDAIGAVVGTKVKTVGLDSLINNSLRDGAEFAWIPSGDTCAFCIMLASNGWQRASKKALKHGHASHVHNNCDCTYAIRFDHDTEVEGYDPDYYKSIYDNADGNNWKDKVNSMRRNQYAVNRDRINAQKRAAYVKRKNSSPLSERERLLREYDNTVSEKVLDAPGFIEKFKGITGIEDVDEAIYESAVEMLLHRNGTNFEDLYLIDAKTGDIIHKLTTCNLANEIKYDVETLEAIRKAKREHRVILAIHNHPGGLPPSLDDGVSMLRHGYVQGIAVGHNLEVYVYTGANGLYTSKECMAVHSGINKVLSLTVDFNEDFWYNKLREFGMNIRRL